jgi:cation/acetate symporter
MMGIFSKRITKEGAVAGMLTGLFATCIYIFLYLGWFFVPGTNVFENIEANWLFGISPLSFGAIGAVLNFAAAIAVSTVTASPPEEIQKLVESVRYPRGAGTAHDH